MRYLSLEVKQATIKAIQMIVSFFDLIVKNRLQQMYKIMHRYIMFWRGNCEKYQSRDRKISQAASRGKFGLKTGIFRKYSSKTRYICLITPIRFWLNLSVQKRKIVVVTAGFIHVLINALVLYFCSVMVSMCKIMVIPSLSRTFV